MYLKCKKLTPILIYFRKLNDNIKTSHEYEPTSIYNLLLSDIKKCMDLDTFKTLIMSWDGRRCQCNLCNVLS